MTSEIRPKVSKEDTFDRLEIRVGRVLNLTPAENAPKSAYVIEADFGKFGIRTSVGRFTRHPADELRGKLILGIVNFEPREIGGITSEFLCLGVQYPKAESGEATIVTPLADAKIGGKLF
jgi:tRNA-binding protein